MCQECGCENHQESLVTIPVSGMDESSKNIIEKALEHLEGVYHPHADPTEGTVSFYLSEVGDLGGVKQALLENGFHV